MKIIYLSFDGKEFETQSECEIYETEAKLELAKKTKLYKQVYLPRQFKFYMISKESNKGKSVNEKFKYYERLKNDKDLLDKLIKQYYEFRELLKSTKTIISKGKKHK